jgi:hypothetical protein
MNLLNHKSISFFTLVIILALTSCSDKKISKISLSSIGKSGLIGDYDFLYGQTSSADYTAPEDLNYQLGFRIEERKILFFKNGDLECECKFVDNPYIETPNDGTILYECKKNSKVWLGFIKDMEDSRIKSNLDFESNNISSANSFPNYFFQKQP